MGKSTLYLLQFNNYFNKQVKVFKTLDEYMPFVVYNGDEYKLNNNAFVPGDGITVPELVVNTPSADFDYLLVVDEERNITSRWFVVEARYIKGEGVRTTGQYTISLHRDLLADYYDEVVVAPVFIEKATIPLTNKLIFNSENFYTNQVKKREAVLKDETGCGWLVGYVSPQSFDPITINVASSGQNFPSSPFTYEELQQMAQHGVYMPLDSWQLTYSGNGQTQYLEVVVNSNTTKPSYQLTEQRDPSTKILWTTGGRDPSLTANAVFSSVMSRKDTLTTAIRTYAGTTLAEKQLPEDLWNQLANMNGVTFTDGTHLFTVSLSNVEMKPIQLGAYLNESTGSAYVEAKGALDSARYQGISPVASNNGYYSGPDTGIRAWLYARTRQVSITSSVIPQSTTTINTSAKIMKDQPYRMFCIPVGSPASIVGTTNFTPNEAMAKTLATTIATAMGGTGTSFIYDLQYLPYLPVREAVSAGDGKVHLLGQENVDYTLVRDGDQNIVQYLLWADTSSFSLTIPYKIEVPTDAVRFKVENETRFVRLTAPNYSASFEFKPTMNYGVDGFEVNATYRPFQPYLHVAPIFTDIGLYGGDFTDERGLVCSGDFSVTILDDYWTDYQIQNKSYADAFARQIDNMSNVYSINRAQQRTAGQINAITSAVSGAGAGFMAGSTFSGGNPLVGGIAGIAGGVISGMASAWGLEQDLKYADRLQSESVSFAKDMYNYSLQNVQAMPYMLGKVSAFTINNKVFPFLEFYEATPEEEEALTQKLLYNGMTIGTIGKIENYLQAEPSFIAGQLIRLDNLGEDAHLASAIAYELRRGIYI
jgi:hypothetical protein